MLALLLTVAMGVSTPDADVPALAAPVVSDAGVLALTQIPDIDIPRSEPPVPGTEELDVGWALVRTIVVLGLVVVLAYLTLNVGLRRLMGIQPAGRSGIVQVLERVSLDQKRALFVVEAGGEVMLLGGAEGSVTLLSKLDRAEVEKSRAERAKPSVELSPFLQRLLGKKGGGDAT